MKVAKKEYSDHGSHGVIVKSTLLKKMTTSLPDLYGDGTSNSNNDKDDDINSSTITNETKSCDVVSPATPSAQGILRQGKKRLSPSRDAVSPSMHHKQQQRPKPSLSSLSSSNVVNNDDIPHPKPQHPKPNTSLLHIALQDESTNNNDINNITQESNNTATAKDKHKCLTNPMEPTSNDGLDNIEGNLIVYKNDYIRVPNQDIHLHQPYHSRKSPDGKSPSKNKSRSKDTYSHPNPIGTTTYQVIEMLGQGTFAQVFKCRNLDTGQLCAVKIVKNKPAYTRQAAIEIEIFIALSKESSEKNGIGIQLHNNKSDSAEDYMVSLLSYFLYQSHLCLVFELLGLNLYELLKRRQFRGLPISVVRNLMKEAIQGTNHLSQKSIVHCDLKPENILVVSEEYVEQMLDGKSAVNDNKKTATIDSYIHQAAIKKEGTAAKKDEKHNIKLIDFGSACFEGQATHTYIQSRFYRSPEVLIGLDYDSAIDMWSLGCVAAELFLGLPILPGVHEHDQLSRICEMIGKIPDWMVEQGYDIFSVHRVLLQHRF